MIEYVNENIWYKKKKRIKRNRRKYLMIFMVIMSVITLIIYYDFVISKQIIYECEKTVANYAVTAVNDTVLESLTGLKYSEIINIEKDTSGNVSLISINTVESNNIARNVSKKSQDKMNALIEKGIPIPIGAFSGIEVLAGAGDEVYIKVASIENTICDFKSEFMGKGINQTLHRLYLSVDVYINLMVPSENKETVISSEVLLCESLIVGKIPEVYLEGNLS